MALTPEAKVKKDIKKILDDRGAVYCMPATGGYGKSGVSDFLVCYNGRFISIEAKAGDGKTTALQDKWLGRVALAKGWPLVVREDNINTLVLVLDYIKGLSNE